MSIRRKHEKPAGSRDYFYILRTRFHSKSSGFHGTIFISQEVHITKPIDSFKMGISMVHQELVQIDEMTVAENIYVGRYKTKAGLIDKKALREETKKLMNELGIYFEPDSLIKQYSVAHRQLIEIVKALSHDASIIIFDEPTAALTLEETSINVVAVRFSTYVISGGLSAIAGILSTARVGSATPNAGTGYETIAISACAIGGVALSGGKGLTIGVFMGALLMGMITNGMNLMYIGSNWQYVVRGVLMILAVFYSQWFSKISAKESKDKK